MFIIVEYGNPYVAKSLDRNSNPNLLALINKTWLECFAFDKANLYKLVPTEFKKINLFKKILAYTFYNPTTNVTYNWVNSGNYEICDIIELVKKGLKDDDDIIQQRFDGDEVLKILKSATNFDELCDMVEIIHGGFEADERLMKILKNVLPDYA